MCQPEQVHLHHSTSWCLLYTGRGSKEGDLRTSPVLKLWTRLLHYFCAQLALKIRLVAELLITDVKYCKAGPRVFASEKVEVVTEWVSFPSPQYKLLVSNIPFVSTQNTSQWKLDLVTWRDMEREFCAPSYDIKGGWDVENDRNNTYTTRWGEMEITGHFTG